MIIRQALLQDLEELLAIYNAEVEQGVATFDLNPKTMEERLSWFQAHQGSHALLVAEIEGRVAGYASLSPYRDKEAYQSTVELSVYVGGNDRKKGIGEALMKAIIDRAREDENLHTVISVITGGNEVSIHLHQKLGFVHCGTMREVGVKFGRYLDIDNFQLMV